MVKNKELGFFGKLAVVVKTTVDEIDQQFKVNEKTADARIFVASKLADIAEKVLPKTTKSK
jgi:hypothetical protein